MRILLLLLFPFSLWSQQDSTLNMWTSDGVLGEDSLHVPWIRYITIGFQSDSVKIDTIQADFLLLRRITENYNPGKEYTSDIKIDLLKRTATYVKVISTFGYIIGDRYFTFYGDRIKPEEIVYIREYNK